MYDPIRQLWVKEEPEEIVRQHLIQEMIQRGYPEALIGVEKALSQFPHLEGERVPLRRVDLVCFGKGIHPEYDLYPLLMIECKGVQLNDKVKRQVAGYNSHVGAYFIAVANSEEFWLGWFDGDQYQWQLGLPEYKALLKSVR